MSGVGLLGTMLLGTGYIYPLDSLPDDAQASYNGYVFSNIEVIDNNYNTNNQIYSSYERIRGDGVGYDGTYKTQKIYLITGYLLKNTCEELESEIDLMTKALSERYSLFKRRRRDGTVIVSYASCFVEFGERWDTTFFIPYTVTITVFDPFMYEEDLIEESFEYTAPGSNSFTLIKGNEKPSPFILIQCGASTNTSSISIDINGTSITCPIDLTNGDGLLINTKNKEVMLNGSQNFEFLGEFQLLKFGTNTINISYTGTLEADVYLLYYPTYA